MSSSLPAVHRRLCGDARRRRDPVLQFPRRPGARNPRPPCSTRLSTGLRASALKFAAAVGMTRYSDALAPFMQTLFAPQRDGRPAGRGRRRSTGRTQLRMAETEKYPHVTYFLNGGREVPFQGEDRIMVPSPEGRHL